ncbi:MAG TPA: stage V sporulation protein AC [Candidatus Ruminococcus gallistercoris]|nr:stage V sporulation protein AC [Candidatus Ruminococcus gallistercoris]
MKTKSAREYDAMVQKASPRSPVLKDCLFAFLFGGAICTLGQGLADLFMLLGFTLQDARTFVSISLIFLSAALTAFGVYDNIAKYAGAGTLVPITGFANSMVSPALEFKSEGFVTGLGSKMFVVSGPVLVFGLSASVFYGVVLYVIGLFQG